MSDKDYSQRDVVDKLGIKPGYTIAFVSTAWEIEPALRERILQRSGYPHAEEHEAVDVVFVCADNTTDAVRVLMHWKMHIKPAGVIWMLTPKRNQAGYVDQNELIAAGKQAGVVDNKVCSISPTTSAMRFVIRKSDRPGSR